MPKSPSHATLDNRKAPWADEAEEVAAREEAVRAPLNIWRQHLPDLFQKFAKIPDPRQPGKVRHKVVVLLFYALIALVFQYPSRRDANRNATSPTLAAALRETFPDIDSIPHFDTVERFLETIPVTAWEDMLEPQIQRLLRQHKVQQFLRLTGWCGWSPWMARKNLLGISHGTPRPCANTAAMVRRSIGSTFSKPCW